MLRLRNRLLPLLRAASSLPSPIHPRACHLVSTSTTVPAPFSLEDYLVASCGLAPAQAREVYKKLSRELLSCGSRRPLDELSLSRLNSASNPDAILALLSNAGLSRVDIAAAVSADPLLLRADVNKLEPRLLALRDRVGLSTPQIARFILVASRALRKGEVVPKVEFFISFFGSFDWILMVLKRNENLFNSSLEKTIKPNIALFHQCGVRDIAKVCFDNPWVLAFQPERVKEFLLRAESSYKQDLSAKHYLLCVSFNNYPAGAQVHCQLNPLETSYGFTLEGTKQVIDSPSPRTHYVTIAISVPQLPVPGSEWNEASQLSFRKSTGGSFQPAWMRFCLIGSELIGSAFSLAYISTHLANNCGVRRFPSSLIVFRSDQFNFANDIAPLPELEVLASISENVHEANAEAGCTL